MKKVNKQYHTFIALCLLVFVIALSGCESSEPLEKIISESKQSVGAEAETATKDQIDEKLDALLQRAETFKSPTREYGKLQKIIINEGALLASVDYPKGGIKNLDYICQDWAQNVLSIYDDESVNKGELIVTYNSYDVGNNYVAVEFYGEFISGDDTAPAELCATFNADKTTGKILKLSDIATESEISAMTLYVLEQTGLRLNEVDNEILNKWLVLDGGIQITLMEGKYLPAEDGIQKILITHENIAKIQRQDDEIAVNAEQPTSTQNVEEITTEPPTKSEAESITETITESESATETATEAAQAASVIALTFDDGPSADTWRLVDLLNSYDIKATFFILGLQIDNHQEVLLHMVESGHELATHSWDHRDFTKQSNDQITNEIMNTRARLYEVTGVDTVVVRPPYGAFNDRVCSVASELGVYFINWNVDPIDWQTRDTNAIVDKILSNAKDGAIVLSHDIYPETVNAYEIAIPLLIERGFKFKTATELIKSGGREPIAGGVYFSR